MKVSYALIRLEFPSERHLNIVLEALKPESRQTLTRRFKVKVEGKGKELTMRFEARDSSALRASINSYLRWVSLINNIISIVNP
ncbi:MAG: KEOPS complex subunit Pcc1 [Candidatus Bathyarchaeia archaeon]